VGGQKAFHHTLSSQVCLLGGRSNVNLRRNPLRVISATQDCTIFLATNNTKCTEPSESLLTITGQLFCDQQAKNVSVLAFFPSFCPSSPPAPNTGYNLRRNVASFTAYYRFFLSPIVAWNFTDAILKIQTDLCNPAKKYAHTNQINLTRRGGAETFKPALLRRTERCFAAEIVLGLPT